MSRRDEPSGVARVPVGRFEAGGGESREEPIVVEEPLEIRVAGEPLVVTMRTPGQDEELVLGFLVAEGLVRSRADVGSIAHCGRPGDEGYGNTVDVAPAPGFAFDAGERLVKRGTLSSSACGVCGRRTIDDLLAAGEPVASRARWSPDAVHHMVESLRGAQPNFALTGGLHASAVAGSAGEIELVREDVGRHNAVDKVVGRLALDGRLPAAESALVVSGRASFEIVQKAYRAGVPMVVAVSAPSSLAVTLAERAGVTLIGFARGGAFNVYSRLERLH